MQPVPVQMSSTFRRVGVWCLRMEASSRVYASVSGLSGGE